MFGMDTMTLNKIAGAVLGTGLLVMGLNILSDAVYHAEKPEEAAINIEVAESDSTEAAKEEAPAVSLATLMASADASKGQAVFKACQACHTGEEGGANKVGPNLYGIVGAQKAHLDNYAYSDALKAMHDQQWTFENLNEFIKNPKGYVKGSKMAYGGLKDDAKRADLLAYLRTLSANPAPLPTE
jgi:cytochrome c